MRRRLADVLRRLADWLEPEPQVERREGPKVQWVDEVTRLGAKVPPIVAEPGTVDLPRRAEGPLVGDWGGPYI